MDFKSIFLKLVGDDEFRKLLDIIDYQAQEIAVLKDELKKHGCDQPKVNNEQRKALAIKAERLGKLIYEYATLFKPDTLKRWYRKLVTRKYDSSESRKVKGRPPIPGKVRDLILRFARENPKWGYLKILGMLKLNGHKVAKSTIANILKENGIVPAPERKRQSTWHSFLKEHRELMWGTDFFSIDILRNGMFEATFYVLFFIHHASRRVVIAGITEHPHEEWMCQMARNLTGWDGELEGAKYIFHDGDGKYCPKFREILRSADIKPKKIPIMSPNLNSYSERFVKSIKEDCLNELIIFTEKQLRKAIREYVDYYHHERPHQGHDIGNEILIPDERADPNRTGEVVKTSRLGGLLNFYYREDKNAA